MQAAELRKAGKLANLSVVHGPRNCGGAQLNADLGIAERPGRRFTLAGKRHR